MRDVLPVLVAISPFAFFIGVQIDASRANRSGALAGSLLLYAGSAHVSLLTLMTQGAGVLSLLTTVLLINSRFLVYSAALAPCFTEQPRWFRVLAPHFVIDQTYALASRRDDLHDRSRFRHYWLTIGSTIAAAWASSMSLGVLAGSAIPRTAAVSSVPTWVILGLLTNMLRARADVVAALTAVLVVLLVGLPMSTRVVLAIVVGGAAGAVTSWAKR